MKFQLQSIQQGLWSYTVPGWISIDLAELVSVDILKHIKFTPRAQQGIQN